MNTPSSRKRREACAEVEVVLQRLGGVDGQLHDRHVGVGVHVRQYRPGTVVNAPRLVVETDPYRIDDLADVLGELLTSPSTG